MTLQRCLLDQPNNPLRSTTHEESDGTFRKNLARISHRLTVY